MRLKLRSSQKEILDLGPDHYTASEYRTCVKKLFKVNQLFGFVRHLTKFLRQFPPTTSVMDVGCGSGLTLLHLSRVFPNMPMLGVDTSSDAIQLANDECREWKKHSPNTLVSFQHLSEPTIDHIHQKIDIIVSTLVCHHLSDSELVAFLQSCYAKAHRAVFIQDLHRHAIAYYFYKWFSPILFRNALISHDGLLSIARSFKKAELVTLFELAGIKHYELKWCFPFRWSITIWKK